MADMCVSSSSPSFQIPSTPTPNLMGQIGSAARDVLGSQDPAKVTSAATRLAGALQQMGLCNDASVAQTVAKTGSVAGLSADQLSSLQRLAKFGAAKTVPPAQSAQNTVNWGYGSQSSFQTA